jgi:hypothetical protein
MAYGATAYNRTVTAPTAGSTKPCSGLCPLHGFVPPHFCAAQRWRVALMRRKNVSYSRNVRRHKNRLDIVGLSSLIKRFFRKVIERITVGF